MLCCGGHNQVYEKGGDPHEKLAPVSLNVMTLLMIESLCDQNISLEIIWQLLAAFRSGGKRERHWSDFSGLGIKLKPSVQIAMSSTTAPNLLVSSVVSYSNRMFSNYAYGYTKQKFICSSRLQCFFLLSKTWKLQTAFHNNSFSQVTHFCFSKKRFLFRIWFDVA